MTRSPDRLEVPELPEARLDLRERLERLPPGHPSSPYEADGTRKPPAAALRTSDLPLEGESGSAADEQPAQSADPQPDSEPFTDAEWTEHVRQVAARLEQAHADGLATDERFTVEPDREVWEKERRVAHNAIIEDMYQQAAGVPNERQAIIAGGLPGAGKTTVLQQHAGIDRSTFLTINPDDIKAEFARRGLIPHVEGLSPMEASDLAHEESSQVAKRLARRAQADGKNLVWDITMSSLASTEARIQDLRSNGYSRIEGVFVDLPPTVSAARADNRHRAGEAEFRAGAGEGGRFIPGDVILENSNPAWGSVNRKTFEDIKSALDAWSLYDNSVDGRAAVLIDRSVEKENP